MYKCKNSVFLHKICIQISSILNKLYNDNVCILESNLQKSFERGGGLFLYHFIPYLPQIGTYFVHFQKQTYQNKLPIFIYWKLS